MGTGYNYVCKTCGKEFTAYLGVGFKYPQLYQDVMNSAREGKLGIKVKQFIINNPHAAIDPKTVIAKCEKCGNYEAFIINNPHAAIDPKTVIAKCEKCGNYEAVPDLGMYLPKKENGSLIHKGNWTVGDFDNKNEYVFEFDQYDLIDRYDHKCTSCGGRMQVLQDEEPESLKCPACGDEMVVRDLIMWD